MEDNIQDYYISTGKKIADFFIGLVGFYIIIWLISIVPRAIYSIFDNGNNSISMSVQSTWFISIFYFIFFILAIAVPLKYKRRYISIGVVSTILIPLLIIGACLILFPNILNGL